VTAVGVPRSGSDANLACSGSTVLSPCLGHSKGSLYIVLCPHRERSTDAKPRLRPPEGRSLRQREGSAAPASAPAWLSLAPQTACPASKGRWHARLGPPSETPPAFPLAFSPARTAAPPPMLFMSATCAMPTRRRMMTAPVAEGQRHNEAVCRAWPRVRRCCSCMRSCLSEQGKGMCVKALMQAAMPRSVKGVQLQLLVHIDEQTHRRHT